MLPTAFRGVDLHGVGSSTWRTSLVIRPQVHDSTYSWSMLRTMPVAVKFLKPGAVAETL